MKQSMLLYGPICKKVFSCCVSSKVRIVVLFATRCCNRCWRRHRITSIHFRWPIVVYFNGVHGYLLVLVSWNRPRSRLIIAGLRCMVMPEVRLASESNSWSVWYTSVWKNDSHLNWETDYESIWLQRHLTTPPRTTSLAKSVSTTLFLCDVVLLIIVMIIIIMMMMMIIIIIIIIIIAHTRAFGPVNSRGVTFFTELGRRLADISGGGLLEPNACLPHDATQLNQTELSWISSCR